MLPVPISQRFEYLSDQWIEEAKRFVSQHAPNIDFSLCESLTNPPPGINGSWWLKIEGTSVTAGAGTIENPDVLVEGDYQAVLAISQTVFAAGDDAKARAMKELVHHAGRDAIRITNEVPREFRRISNTLHDHMAARTIENPNIEHRLNALGVSEHAKALAEDGYVIIENAISPEFADTLRKHVKREALAYGTNQTNALIHRHRVFEEIVMNPLLLAVLHSSLSQAMILGAMSGMYKKKGPGQIPMHADISYMNEPFPEWPVAQTACWALDDWTEAAGPTWVVPGSHKLRRYPRLKQDTLDGGIPITMPKGSVAIWDAAVWHWQGDRTMEKSARVTLHATYQRVFMRSLEDTRLSDAILERNSPAFHTLMGFDDPFGESNHKGMNFELAKSTFDRAFLLGK